MAFRSCSTMFDCHQTFHPPFLVLSVNKHCWIHFADSATWFDLRTRNQKINSIMGDYFLATRHMANKLKKSPSALSYPKRKARVLAIVLQTEIENAKLGNWLSENQTR